MEKNRRTCLNSSLLAEDSFPKMAGMTDNDQSTEMAGTTRNSDKVNVFEASSVRASLTSGITVTLLHAEFGFA